MTRFTKAVNIFFGVIIHITISSSTKRKYKTLQTTKFLFFRSFVDYFKMGIFMYGHWLTLVMVFAAGLGGTSLFALGYLVLAFWILWQGNNLYTMKHYRRTLSRWNFLLGYNVFVMFLKVALQVRILLHFPGFWDFSDYGMCFRGKIGRAMLASATVQYCVRGTCV
jgi:hypothetical protein